jgi:uncharacterized protein DUF4430
VRRVCLAAALAVALAGCGSDTSGAGSATVWVTRARGAHVLHVARVPAGVSAMQALDRVAKLKTRFGGRYVRVVDGLEEHGSRAWFYYVNGYLADRSAAEYRLRPGDVEWWDYRDWRDPAQDPVLVGAFPEPFLHGYDGRRRPTAILFAGRTRRRGALALGKILHTRFVRPEGATPPRNANVLLLAPAAGSSLRFQETSRPPPRPGGAVFVAFSGDPLELAKRPRMFRFRYSVP